MTPAALDDPPSSRTHHLPAAGLALIATGGTVLLSVALDGVGRLAAVAVLQLALAAAWVTATGIRGSLGSLGLGVLAAAGADAAVLLPERPELDAVGAVLGLGFLASVVHQMARRPPRLYLVASLAGVVLLLSSICALALLLATGRLDGGPRALLTAVAATGAAVVVGHLVDWLLPRPEITAGVPRGVLGLVLAVLAAVAVALLLRDAGAVPAAAYGAAVGGTAALAALVASYVAVERGRAGWALPVLQAVLPLAAAAPVGYTLAMNGIG